MEALIKDSTNEGDIVFDPCCGSGSTLVAAANLGRHFIGIELQHQWHQNAAKRVFDECGVVVPPAPNADSTTALSVGLHDAEMNINSKLGKPKFPKLCLNETHGMA
ncbi:MAG: site-specific DNA-methyltransferase [Defluviitaleaceae bacterium]|nr:site-specific DNA-methyltransferase [Defluviitaleaceae bacterium]